VSRVRFPPPALSGSRGTLFTALKTYERTCARKLRADRGYSIKQIAALLGVSTSSVSLWVRDIELTPEQHEALRERNPIYNGQLSGRAASSARRRAERSAYQERGRALARRGDPLHVTGCMLYWAEGSKDRNCVQFTNSDPAMVLLFVRFLRFCLDVRPEDIRLACYLYADHVERQQEVERFWLQVTGLPETSLRRSIVNAYSKSSARKRVNKLPYGTCRVVVNRTSVVQSIYGSIQEYGGFERPAWLG
jgi:transcriptional regulator with XRE-family HTH domain